jgi:hypothetical protein
MLRIRSTVALLAFLAVACAPAEIPAGATAAPAPAPVPAPEAAPAPTGVDTLSPGVTHRYTWDAEGPWAIHVVEVAPRACGVTLRTAAAHDGIVGAELTSRMAWRAAPGGGPALVAINADFFRATPPGVPEGPQVAAGEVVVAEGSYGPSVSTRFHIAQPVFGVARGGGAFVGEARLEGSAWTRTHAAYPLARVNAPAGPDSLALYNRFAGGTTPPDTGVVEVSLRTIRSAAAAGDTARAVVLGIRAAAGGTPLPADGVVLSGRGRAAAWLRGVTAGDTVVWALPVAGAPGPVEELLGGFPLLLRGGEAVLDGVPTIREAFALRRHPRSAVALRPDGTVLIVAVDGRQPGYSDGMTLPELTTLLRELGATEALNLDGGGSTTLVVRGAIVNRPSEADGERPVANALLVLGPAEGVCAGGGGAAARP